MSRTGLGDEDFTSALAKVQTFLGHEPQVTNARLRALTGLNYDQAIKFFNLAVAKGVLERRGRASGIHYVLTKGPDDGD